MYVDAKRLTLSANSWPARYVTNEASQKYDYANSAVTIPHDINLQYVNPPTHSALLSCIVEAEVNTIIDKIKSSNAVSLRIDGSIDRTQIDKIYVMAKIVTSEGKLELIFLGVGEQTKRGAAGLLEAALTAIEDNCGKDTLTAILKKLSSICTDGANVNTGEKGGLWGLLEKQLLEAGCEIPLIKLWCAAHRSDLSWGDLTPKTPRLIAQLPPEVKIVDKILSILSNLSSHFHNSAARTTELKEIAKQHNLKVLSMPKLFTIRWTEHTYDLIRAVMTSWNAVVLFLEKDKETCPKSSGFFKYVSNLNFLKMVAFLGDVLRIFKRMQKKLQSDSLTLMKMSFDISVAKSTLETLKDGPMLGGYESHLHKSVTLVQNKFFLKDIQLSDEILFRTVDTENFRVKVVECLVQKVDERFEIENEELVSVIQPFTELKTTADIGKVHEIIAKDLDLNAMAMQYMDLSAASHLKELSFVELVRFLTSAEQKRYYEEMSIVFCRILAATPHSADVERCVHANNLLKTYLRSSFLIENENKYLFVHFNMPALEEWCPKKAAAKWVRMVERRQRNISTSVGKATAQPYFKGIFKKVDGEKEVKKDEDMSQFHF